MQIRQSSSYKFIIVIYQRFSNLNIQIYYITTTQSNFVCYRRQTDKLIFFFGKHQLGYLDQHYFKAVTYEKFIVHVFVSKAAL